MNKKFIIVILILLVIIVIGGLYLYMNSDSNNENELNVSKSDENETSNTVSEESNNSVDNNDTKESNVLVLYFSATNTTETIAEYISEITGGDLIEIIPEEEYTSDDLNYNNSNSRANQEQNDDNARPEIANSIDISEYDTIYLGYPIWWGDVPKIILTLLDTYDFTGKTVIPFCTSGSTGIATSVNTLKNYDDTVNWQDGMRFSSSSTKEDVEEWINK